MSADPKSLARDSACWCLKGTAQRGARLYLLNKWANASPAPACIPPAAPVLSLTAFVLLPADGYLRPMWTEAADPALDFLFAYGTTPGGPYPDTVSFGASARNGIVPGVVVGTQYYGVIYARTSVSCVSLASNEASATPIPALIGAPTAPVLSIDGYIIVITASGGYDTGGSYEVEVSSDSGSSWGIDNTVVWNTSYNYNDQGNYSGNWMRAREIGNGITYSGPSAYSNILTL